MLELSRENIAWVAGLFEGEGSIRQSDRPYFEITQVDRESLDKAFSIFPFGRVYGPYNNKKGRQAYHRWIVCKFEHVQAIMAAIWPWLSNRRKAQFKAQYMLVLAKFRDSKYFSKHGKVYGGVNE